MTDALRKNKVISQITYACPVENDELTGKRFKIAEVSYDKFGYPVEHFEYKRGKIEKWNKFKYDNKRRVIEKTWYQCIGYDKDKFKPYTTKYSYDEKGELITSYKPIYETDANGDNKVETTFFLNGKLKSKRFFHANGTCREEIEYKSEVIGRCKNFDEKGNLLSEYSYDKDGKQLSYIIHEYDNQGNNTRIKKVAQDGRISQDRTLIYDKYNNLIEDKDIPKQVYRVLPSTNTEWLNDDHSESYRHCYKYNEKQLLVEMRLYLATHLIMTYEYDYKFHIE